MLYGKWGATKYSRQFSIIEAKHAPTRLASVAFKCQNPSLFARRQGRPKFLQWNEMGKKERQFQQKRY
jgi:hypothetical protein